MTKQQIDWWLARFGIYMTALVMSHLLIGLYLFPIDRYIPLEPGTNLQLAGQNIHPVLEVLMWGNTALLVACIILVSRRSRWVLPGMAIYLIAAKLTWVYTVYLTYYNGDGFALWVTLFQLIGLIFSFRAAWPEWKHMLDRFYAQTDQID